MVRDIIEGIGAYVLMMKKTLKPFPNRPVYWRQLLADSVLVALRPLVLVSVIGAALGAVVVMMALYMLDQPVIPKTIVGLTMRETMLLELGPTGIGALLANFLGFVIAFDLGEKKRSEQIAALNIMGVPVESYLVLPKLIAGVLFVPCLMVVATFCAFAGGYIYSVITGVVSARDYTAGLQLNFQWTSMKMFLIKSYVIAFLLPTVSSCFGLSFEGDIKALSRMSTMSIFYNCIIILLADYVITVLMLN